MEIGDNPDFENLQNLLKDNVRDDFIKFIMKDSKLDNNQDKTNNDHFKHYNSCIKKLSVTLKTQKTEIELLNSALEFQSKQINIINTNAHKNNTLINKIKQSFIFKLFKIPL